jgi:hypothetical protein
VREVGDWLSWEAGCAIASVIAARLPLDPKKPPQLQREEWDREFNAVRSRVLQDWEPLCFLPLYDEPLRFAVRELHSILNWDWRWTVGPQLAFLSQHRPVFRSKVVRLALGEICGEARATPLGLPPLCTTLFGPRYKPDPPGKPPPPPKPLPSVDALVTRWPLPERLKRRAGPPGVASCARGRGSGARLRWTWRMSCRGRTATPLASTL